MMISAGLLVVGRGAGLHAAPAPADRRAGDRRPSGCASRTARTAVSPARRCTRRTRLRGRPDRGPGRSAQRRAAARSRIAGSGSAPGAVSTWAQTWSAPASRCSSSRAATVGASPCATSASISRSLPPSGDVVLGPAEPQQVGGVVAQAEVGLVDGRPADGAGALRVGVQHDLVLRGQQHARAEQLAGLAGVLGGGQVRVGARGALRGDLAAPSARAPPAPGPDRHLGRVERVQVLDHRGVGLRYSLVASGWPMPTPSRNRPGCAARSGGRTARPPPRAVAHMLTMPVATAIRSVAASSDSASRRSAGRRTPDPDRAVAELLDLGAPARASSPPADRQMPYLTQFDSHETRNTRCGPSIPAARSARLSVSRTYSHRT